MTATESAYDRLEAHEVDRQIISALKSGDVQRLAYWKSRENALFTRYEKGKE
jgi:hypothetical protein